MDRMIIVMLMPMAIIIGASQQSNDVADRFPLSIIHINDFHARFEPTDTSGGTCDEGELCIGGYARTVYMVKRLLEEQKDHNPIYINAGDSFQGTLWYNIGRWNVTQEFLNLLPADAMTLGNHEFDHGVAGVVPFLKTVQTSMLVANMDCAHEPTMEGLYEKSKILERGGRKIGLIGVILETTYDLANTGNLIFRNESHTIREEARFLTEQGANIIIVISHCGYDVDKLIAEQAGDVIDVIVGAHSHTFLYTGVPPGPDSSRGDYPTEVTHSNGHRVLIVQAGAYAKYVGNLTVYFDANGDVIDFEGAPIYMSADVPEDEIVLKALQPWKEVIDKEGKVVVGRTLVDLTKSDCGTRECNLGNFVCDSMLHTFVGLTPFDQPGWTNVSIALAATGGLRVPLLRGNLTYAHMVSMSPFENTLIASNLPGQNLIDALEYAASKIDLENGVTSSYVMLQVSGLKVTFDYTKPVNKRVISVLARCADCDVPTYEPLDPAKTYRVITSSFLQGGGDGYSMLSTGTDVQTSITDIDALISYTSNVDPIYTGLEGRITVLNGNTAS
ncbi:apyrase isoform X1 [Drosophila hydei]|uniref:apyrase n=1 Tax=Drosophila hydei TaxID=7224 RepID=A0A6J1LD22_DROHY|nr:apyrase isoform X1 [Drosophila hydei]